MKQEESSEPAAASKEYACTALEQVSQTSVSLPSSFASMRAHRHDSRNLLGSGVCDMTDFCEVSSVHKLGKKKSLQAGPEASPLPRALDGGMWGEHDRSSSVP